MSGELSDEILEKTGSRAEGILYAIREELLRNFGHHLTRPERYLVYLILGRSLMDVHRVTEAVEALERRLELLEPPKDE